MPVQNARECLAPIVIRLVRGDALARDADLAVIGSGPPLRARIEQQTGDVFVPLQYPQWMQNYGSATHFKSTRFLNAPNFIWRNVLAFGPRLAAYRRPYRQNEMLDALLVGVRHSIRPRKLLFVPYHQREPELVVLSTLLMIYLLMRESYGRRKIYQPQELEIVDLDSVEIFPEVLNRLANRPDLQVFLMRKIDRFGLTSANETVLDPRDFSFI
jgi:hypothetical protein